LSRKAVKPRTDNRESTVCPGVFTPLYTDVYQITVGANPPEPSLAWREEHRLKSFQEVNLSLWVGPGLTTLTVKNKVVRKCYVGPQTLTEAKKWEYELWCMEHRKSVWNRFANDSFVRV
jgi:hypothetical protein